MLEDVCLESIKSDPVMECIDQFIECVKASERSGLSQRLRPKRGFHAYLASQDRPDLRLGEAAESGIWNFDSDAFGH